MTSGIHNSLSTAYSHGPGKSPDRSRGLHHLGKVAGAITRRGHFGLVSPLVYYRVVGRSPMNPHLAARPSLPTSSPPRDNWGALFRKLPARTVDDSIIPQMRLTNPQADKRSSKSVTQETSSSLPHSLSSCSDGSDISNSSTVSASSVVCANDVTAQKIGINFPVSILLLAC